MRKGKPPKGNPPPIPKFLYGEDFVPKQSRLWVHHTKNPSFIARVCDADDGSLKLAVHPLTESDTAFEARPQVATIVRAAARSFLRHIDGRRLRDSEQVAWKMLAARKLPEYLFTEDSRALRFFVMRFAPRPILAEIYGRKIRIASPISDLSPQQIVEIEEGFRTFLASAIAASKRVGKSMGGGSKKAAKENRKARTQTRAPCGALPEE